MRSRKAFRVAAALVLAAGLSGCGGSDPTPVPTPTPGPSQARITVTCTGTGAAGSLVTASPRAGFTYRIVWPCTLVESAGLGANINFVRMRLTRAGSTLEIVQISGNDIVAGTGSNRLNANQTRSANIQFDFNAGEATGGSLDFNFTDDRGNTQEATLNFTA
jgi:hypothetical protein